MIEFNNSSGGECGSDINAKLQPGSHTLWVTGGVYGGAGGRWEPTPEGISSGTGVMTYPEGVTSWPLTLPVLAPGAYTIAVPMTCEAASPRVVEAELTIQLT